MSPRALNIASWCIIALIVGGSFWAYPTDRLAAVTLAMGLLAAVACIGSVWTAVGIVLYPPRPLIPIHNPRKWGGVSFLTMQAIFWGAVSLYLLVPAFRLLVDRLFAW